MSNLIHNRTIKIGGEEVLITVRYDGRLRKSVTWVVHSGYVEVRVPRHIDIAGVADLLDNTIIPKLHEDYHKKQAPAEASPPVEVDDPIEPRTTQAGDKTTTIQAGDETITITVTRDKRLRGAIKWSLIDRSVEVHVPKSMGRRKIRRMLDEDLIPKILRQRARTVRLNDEELETRAKRINRKCFDGEIRWHSIRWVSNMKRRLGSFSHGGTTDGDIRISERIREWPTYVVDYVIAHELTHRLHPDHSAAFWADLMRYPHTERARGFIEGIAYAEGGDADDLL